MHHPFLHVRRAPLAVLAIGVIALVGAAAWALSRDNAGAPVIDLVGPTYTEGVAGTWQRINPIYAGPTDNEVDQDLAQLVFSGLTRLSTDGTVLPDLAERWEISEDQKSYTFHLRKGLKWHDGQPLTAADVAFTVKQLTDADFRGDPLLADSWLDIRVTTPDRATIVFTLASPYAPFLARNTTLGIIPEHLLRDFAPEALFAAPFNSEPIGTGPFRVSAITSAEATLVANRDYHLDRPAIGTVKLRFFADYPSAIRAFQAGDLNGLIMRDTASDQQASDLKAVKDAAIQHVQRGAYMVLYLNNEHVPFDDPRVRQAISRAIDREAIAERVYGGGASPSSSAIAPGTWTYAQQYDDARQNAEEARKLLEQAGWKPAPGTGILVKEGTEFRFTLRTDYDPLRIAMANEVASQLQEVGIRVSVASTSFSVLLRDFLQQREYDAALALWDQGADPDPYAAWHSSQTGPGGLNIANFGDFVVDSLIAQGRTSTDPEVRREAYRQVQELWQRLMPSVIIAYPRYTYALTRSLEGEKFGVLFSASLRFAGIVRWKL